MTEAGNTAKGFEAWWKNYFAKPSNDTQERVKSIAYHAWTAGVQEPRLSPAPQGLPPRPKGMRSSWTEVEKYISTLESMIAALQAEVVAKDAEWRNVYERTENDKQNITRMLERRVAEADSMSRQRGDIANALVDVAMLLGITSGSYAMTGPELVMLAEDAMKEIESMRRAIAETREKSDKAIDLLQWGNFDTSSSAFTRLLHHVCMDHPRNYGTDMYFLAQTSEAEHLANWNARRKEFLALLPAPPEQAKESADGK